MKWTDDLPDDWDRAPDHPPVSADDEALPLTLLGVGFRHLETDCADHC